MTIRELLQKAHNNKDMQVTESEHLTKLLNCNNRPDIRAMIEGNPDSLYWAVKGLISIIDTEI